MRLINASMGFLITILTLLLSAQWCFSAQTSVHAILRSEQLEDVKIETQGVRSLFSELSFTYDIPIGLEVAANETESAWFYVDFKKGTLAELLIQFVGQHTQYTWAIEDGVVNVFPRPGYRDLMSKEILAVRIEKFLVKEKTSCWDFVASVLDKPETKAILDANDTTYTRPSPSGFYIPQLGSNFTLDVADLTLRSILNKTIRESPTAKFWVVTRNPDRTLFMHVGAQPENSLKIDKRELQELLRNFPNP